MEPEYFGLLIRQTSYKAHRQNWIQIERIQCTYCLVLQSTTHDYDSWLKKEGQKKTDEKPKHFLDGTSLVAMESWFRTVDSYSIME